MILTGKCLDDFYVNLGEQYIESLEPICRQALIIDFFDGNGLWEDCFEIEYSNNIDSFKNICIRAIKKANQIYNEIN